MALPAASWDALRAVLGQRTLAFEELNPTVFRMRGEARATLQAFLVAGIAQEEVQKVHAGAEPINAERCATLVNTFAPRWEEALPRQVGLCLARALWLLLATSPWGRWGGGVYFCQHEVCPHGLR